MEALVYGADKVSTTKHRQFQLRLTWAKRAATTCSDGDRPKTIECLECKIHQVTPVKCKLFNKSFQHHESQQLQEVRTKAIGPRRIFAKQLGVMKTAAAEEADGAANMTADKWLEFQNRLWHAETEATTWSLANPECVTNQLEKEIYGFTWNEQKRFNKESSICLIEFQAWWETIAIQVLRKTIGQHIMHFGYPEMHLVSHISETICWMGSGDHITTDISERLHFANMKEAYRSSNKVNCIRQMLKHNDRCTSLDYMEETLSYLTLEGWYDVDSANVFNLLSASDKWWSTLRAHLLCLQIFQDEPCIHPVSPQVYYLRATHVSRVFRGIKLSSLRDASEDFRIANFGQLFRTQIEQDCGHKVSGLVLGYDQNGLIDSISIKLWNGLLYYHQPFHNPTSVDCLELDCKVDYSNAIQGIMPEVHNIWVQYTQSEENDLDKTFQGRIPSFAVW